MEKQQLHPKYAQSFIDSCAFDPGDTEEFASRRILENSPQIIVAHSVQKELEHPNTPSDVKSLADKQIYTIKTSNTPDLIILKKKIRILVQGNARLGKHDGDASHLFNLYKFGGGYFITTDERLLSLSERLFQLCCITTIKPTDYEKLLKINA